MTPPKQTIRLTARDAARLAEQVFGVPQRAGQAAAAPFPGESRAGGAASSKPHRSTDGGQG